MTKTRAKWQRYGNAITVPEYNKATRRFYPSNTGGHEMRQVAYPKPVCCCMYAAADAAESVALVSAY